jgi:hypothetical protein
MTDYARLGDAGAWVFLASGGGSFTTSFQTYPSLNFGLPSSWQPITGDFNGDGMTDYARLGDTEAWVFFGSASGSFTTSFQTYPSLNFGLPSSWQPITGDFNGDGMIDYARLGDTGAWGFFGSASGSFTTGFQSYEGLTFGSPSAWQVVTGNFKGDGKAGYARLGGPLAYVFVHR